MRVLFINPNATVAMTEAVAETARAAAGSGVEIVARTNHAGPASIQGEADGEAALPGLFAEIDRAAGQGFAAIVIACFDDTGLMAARARAGCPVIGIGEAAYHTATLVAERFSVVTTLAVSVPVIQENIMRYGLAARCGRVRASNVPVLELERPGSTARETISERDRERAAVRQFRRHRTWLRGHGGSGGLPANAASGSRCRRCGGGREARGSSCGYSVDHLAGGAVRA